MIRVSVNNTGVGAKVVTDLQYYNQDSRYRKLRKYIDEESKYFHDLPKPFDFKGSEDDTYYKVESQSTNRLDYVAHVVYRNSKLWWVIAMANDIEDPNNVPLGTVLTIPSQSSLFGHGGALS